MLSFAWPWLVVLAPLPWVVRRFARSARPAQDGAATLLNPYVGRLKSAFSGALPGRGGGRLRPLQLLGILLWLTLVVAMMRPQWLDNQTEMVSLGYDLMLAVDVSGSMEALDFTVNGRPVNRLAVVKGVVSRFVDQRKGDRIGLVLFGDSAYLQSPLTLDGEAVKALLANAVPRMAGDATAIGDAVGLAVKKLRERPEGSRVLVFLTDGENTAGSLPPLEAVRLAAQYGIRVYTIGVGTKGEVPMVEDGRLTMKETKMDEELLRRMAAVGGGAYFRATDTAALEKIYQRIDALEKTKVETRSTLVPTSLHRWPVGAALLLLLAMAILALGVGVHARAAVHGDGA